MLKLVLSLAIVLPGLASAAVPHVFSAGSPVVASEVNTNYSDLDTRVDTLQGSTTVFPDFSGYDMPFSTDGAPKNVVVLANTSGPGSLLYSVVSYYANSTEQVSIDGTMTIRPFIVKYIDVETDLGNNIVNIEGGTDTPDTSSYLNYNVEDWFYDTTGTTKTITSDITRELVLCNATGSANLCVVQEVLSINGSHAGFFGFGQIRTTTGPYTINGMTFNDVIIDSSRDDEGGSNAINAKGIGYVRFEDEFSGIYNLIYYRVDGVTGGSLIGTPFATGQPLDGLFF